MSAAAELTGRELWARRVRETPDRPFLIWGARSWTFAELDTDVRRVAGGLSELGVGRETRVLAGLSNRAETVIVQLALQMLGAVHVPLLGGLSFDELAYQAEHSGGELLIADEPVASTLVPRLAECPVIKQVVPVGDAFPGREPRFDDLLRHDPLPIEPLDGYDDRSLMAILYTSGSTGRPKGVMLPAGSFFSCGQAFAERYGIVEDDNFILPVPLAHATGALTAQSIALHAGCRLTVVDRFSPSAFWAQVAETGADGDNPLPRPAQPAAGGGAGVAAAGPHAAATGDHPRLERALPPVLRRRARHGLGHDGDRRALRRQRPRRERRRGLHRRAHDRSETSRSPTTG